MEEGTTPVSGPKCDEIGIARVYHTDTPNFGGIFPLNIFSQSNRGNFHKKGEAKNWNKINVNLKKDKM